jgi:hypothetical protein
MHQRKVQDISIGFTYEKFAGRRYRQCFLLDKSCRKMSGKMHTIFSAVLRQKRKSDVMTSFGHATRSAIYYKAVVFVFSSHWKTLLRQNDKYRFVMLVSQMTTIRLSYWRMYSCARFTPDVACTAAREARNYKGCYFWIPLYIIRILLILP